MGLFCRTEEKKVLSWEMGVSVRVGVAEKVMPWSGMTRKFFISKPEMFLLLVLMEKVRVTGLLTSLVELVETVMIGSVEPDALWRISWFCREAMKKRKMPIRTTRIGIEKGKAWRLRFITAKMFVTRR